MMAKSLTSGSGTMAHPDGFHILAELASAEGLTAPIKATSRIKYACIGVSKNYIGLGASSGSLYVFHRTTFKYLQVFSNTEGALTRVVFAPNDNMVGLATSQGTVITWELNIERRVKSERLAISSAHRNGTVTAMIWDTASERLFSGDNHGRITFVNVFHRKMAGLFKLPTELVMDADSAIVQLDYCDDKLLASTTTKCFICDTKKKQAYAVGTKLRDGQFGACFLQKATKEFPLVYSARPSSRMWEGNIVGQVQATHQFKHLLAVPSLPVVGPGRSPIFPSTDHVQKSQALNFAQLVTFGHGHNLLLTWTTKAIYVFDPAHIKVMVWSMDFKDILWACVFKNRVYCLHPNSQVSCYTLLSAERCISKLYALSLWEQCAHAAVYFAERVKQGSARRFVPRSLIQEVNYQLMDGNADRTLMGKMEELLSNMEEDGLSTPGSSRRSSLDSFDGVRLDSGIYMVRNRAASDDSVENFPIQKIRPVVVDQETQMDGGMEEFSATDDGKSVKEGHHDNTANFGDALNQKVASLAFNEPLESEKESGFVDPELSFDSDFDKDITTFFHDTAPAISSFREEAAEKITNFGNYEDFDEEVEVDGSFAIEDEELEGPGDLASGPAGINWGFSQGKLGIRRQSSLLEEIAEALVKDGELDTSIAESLNSSSDDHVTCMQTDPRADDRGDSQPSPGWTEGSSHGNQGASTNQYRANSSGISSHSTTSSIPDSNSPLDHSGTGIGHDQHIPNSGQPTSITNSLTTQDSYSQLGQTIPNEAASTLKSFRNGEAPSMDKSSKHCQLPLESAAVDSSAFIDLRNSSYSEESEVEHWPVIHRSISMPTAGHVTSFDMDGRRPRKQSYSKDKKRSKKSRVIDFDNPQASSTVSERLKSDSAFAAAITPKDPSKQPVRNPPTSTPTKRSQSLTNVPTDLDSPTSLPPKRSSQPVLHPHSQVDSPRLSSYSTESMAGAGMLHSSEDMFWGGASFGGPPMMLSVAGQKLAASAFSAVKESLSSKLVRTKSFLKQMSEPEVGSLPADQLVTMETHAEALQIIPPDSPSSDPSFPQHSPPMNTLPTGVPQSPKSENQLVQSSLPKASPFESQTSLSKVVDPEQEKSEYCSGLTDDTVIKKLALSTWNAKHSLQDPKMSLSRSSCHKILEKWLHVLQNALASKNHHLQTELFEEVKDTQPVNQKLVDANLELSGEDKGAPSVGQECPVSAENSLTNKDLQVGHNNTLNREALSLPVRCRSKSGSHQVDPLGLPEQVLQDVSRLVMLCFEMAVFGSDAIVQSDPPSDTERSGSFQDESSSPETDQSHRFLDPNMNTLDKNSDQSQSVIGQFHPNSESQKFTNQSNAFSHDTSQPNESDTSSQRCVSTETESMNLEEQDQKAANFVTSFFFLLDVERVRVILKWREGWRKQTMAAILDCLQARERENETEVESISRLVQVIEDDQHKGKQANIFHIYRLIQHGQIDTALDVMLGAFPDLAPWEVQHLTQADTAPPGCFLDYVTALLESVEAMDRDTMLASICSDLEVKCHLLTSTLSQGAPTKAKLFCTCGNLPRPGSHMLVWQYGTLTDQILSLPGTGKDRLLNICLQHGCWQGVLKLYLELQQRGPALKMVVQLADMNLISQDGILPMNMDEWVLLLNLMSQSQSVSQNIRCLSCNALLLTKQDNHWLTASATTQRLSEEVYDWSNQDSSSKPECDWGIECKASNQGGIKLLSDWSPSVTWEIIGTLLVKSIGPGLAARMLTDSCVPCGELSKQFYKNCILASMLDKHESDVCLSMLEGTDTYLWSKRNNTMAPSIYHQVQQERTRTMNYEATSSETFISKVPKPNAVSMDSFLFIEDTDCHWGTNVKLNSDCVVCGHALSAAVSARMTGLSAFPCGHTFHSACVVERACVLCYELKCQTT